MGNLLTRQGSDGRNLPAVQPVSGSVAGSPFTVATSSSSETPQLRGMIVMIASEAIHVRFSPSGEAATSNDILVPSNQWFVFPVEGDILSMLASSAEATVWIENARETL